MTALSSPSIRRFASFLIAVVLGCGAAHASAEEIMRQLRLLNQIPEASMNEKADPAYAVLKKIYDLDAPDFLVLRRLLGAAKVRSTLNPTTRAVCADIVSQRWDSFTISGNLYLSGIKSRNLDLRERSRRKLINFIQAAHIPALIQTLKTPGANVAALDALREVTGEDFGAEVKAWESWWNRAKGRADLVGRLLDDTRERMDRIAIQPFEQERFWYAPDGVRNVLTPYAERSKKEQDLMDGWNQWAAVEVKRYVDTWALAKPILERIKHQPDPRVNAYLEQLADHPGWGDYASIVLAWRGSRASLPVIQQAYRANRTVGRALARGSLGDATALDDLLVMLEERQKHPMSYGLMDDQNRQSIVLLRQVGVVPAELAFELLSHRRFDFDGAATQSEKRRACKEARRWLDASRGSLRLDGRRGYFVTE